MISNIPVTCYSNYQNMLLLEITTYCISKELSSSVTCENGRIIVVSIETGIFVWMISVSFSNWKGKWYQVDSSGILIQMFMPNIILLKNV